MTFTQWVAGGRRFPFDGHCVFVRQDGPRTGPAVTLIHGFPTSSHDWSSLVPALVQAGCRVTVVDLLGFGASDKPRRHRYSIVEQASVVQAAWEHCGVGDTAVVAHDYGVSVVQELLARDPARIRRAAFLNGGLYPDLHRPLLIQRLMRGRLGPVLGHVVSERTFRSSMRRVLGRQVSDEWLHQMWLAVRHNGGVAVQHRLLGYIADRSIHADRWTRALEDYSGPRLFVWGPADPISGAHVVPRLRERMPDARVVVLAGAPATGHYPQIESPSDTVAALVPFLTAVERLERPEARSSQ